MSWRVDQYRRTTRTPLAATPLTEFFYFFRIASNKNITGTLEQNNCSVHYLIYQTATNCKLSAQTVKGKKDQWTKIIIENRKILLFAFAHEIFLKLVRKTR